MWDLISNYLGPLITTVTAFIFMKFILKKEIKIAPIYVVVIILFVPSIASLSILDNYMFLRTMLSCFLCLLLYMFTFELGFFKAMFFSIIYFLLLTISELFTFLVLAQILHVSNDYLYNVFADSILSNSVMGLLSLLFGWLFRKLLIKVDNIKFKNTFQIYLVLLFVVFLFFFYITFTNIGKGIDIVAGIVVVVALLVVTMHLISQTYRNNALLDKYDKLLKFIKKYETEIDNQRTVRHELKNQLLTIQSKILDNDKKENISANWHFDGEGYDLDNSVNPCDYMTISDEVKIINQTYQNKVYKFKNRKDINVYTKGLYRTLDNVRVRCGAGLNFRQKKVKELTPDGKKHSLYSDLNALAYLKKGTYFDALEIIVNASGVWAKGYSGYINIKSGKYINSEKV